MFNSTRPHVFLYGVCLFLAILVFTMIDSSAHAQTSSGDPFRVENIKIDITAESAVKARDEAFKKAQTKSIPVLMKQLEAAEYDTTRLKSVGNDTLANAIKNFEISDEQFSSVRYKAVISFDYSESKLKKYMVPKAAQLENYNATPTGAIPDPSVYKADNAGSETLILPFLQVGNAPLKLWSQNLWLETWMRASPVNAIVPIGDVSDIRDISDSQALTYNPQNLQNMMSRYAAQRGVVLLASYTGVAMPQTLGEVNYGRMNVAVYDTRNGRPQFIEQVSVNPNPAETLDAFLSRAVSASMQVINRLPSATQNQQSAGEVTYTTRTTTTATMPAPIAAGPLQSVRGRVDYTSIGQWMGVQQRIRAIPGVAGLQVLSLRPKQADVLVSYAGDGAQIIPLLRQQGVALEVVQQQRAYR